MALKQFTAEELKEKKRLRNAVYNEANRAALAKDKRKIYKDMKADVLVNGPDRRVQDLELAHGKALRVERNDRYRWRLLKSQRNRAYYLSTKAKTGFSTDPKTGQKWGGNGAETLQSDAKE